MKSNLTRLDIATWFGFMIFAASGVITPMCLPEISKTLSTDLSEGGGMESARAFMIFIVVILAGVCAHTWGKRLFITSGQYLLAAGLLMISYSQSYPMLIISLMFTGIGGGFTEALINPLVVDIHPENSGKYLNLSNAFYSVGVLVSALLFGELLTLGCSWRVVFRVAAAGALAVGVFFSRSRFPTPMKNGDYALNRMADTLLLPGFRLFAAAIFLGAGVESAFTFWSRSYVAIYIDDVPRAGAIAVMIFAGMMAAGRLLSAALSKTISQKMIMMCSALIGLVVSSIIPFTASLIWFYALLAIAGLATACFWPTILAEAALCLKTDSTILFVLLACFGIAGFGVTPWIMGVIGDKAGLIAGFSMIPGFFLCLIIVLTFEWRLSRTCLKRPGQAG
ncbi:sugar MFS transporter [Candidatus Latescibacterota bacterium]